MTTPLAANSASFRPFHRNDLSAYARWFDDEELARRVSFPDQAWLDYVMTPNGIAHAVVACTTKHRSRCCNLTKSLTEASIF